jgi:hypothetical protein
MGSIFQTFSKFPKHYFLEFFSIPNIPGTLISAANSSYLISAPVGGVAILPKCIS